MEGCGDGIWDGARYFSCRPGYGFFYPLSSLALDERYKVPANNRKIPMYVYTILSTVTTLSCM